MRCIDSTFCTDLANGSRAAVAKAEELSEMGGRPAIPAPALTEFRRRAFHPGGKLLSQVLEFISELEIFDGTEPISVDAGAKVRKDRRKVQFAAFEDEARVPYLPGSGDPTDGGPLGTRHRRDEAPSSGRCVRTVRVPAPERVREPCPPGAGRTHARRWPSPGRLATELTLDRGASPPDGEERPRSRARRHRRATYAS